MPTFEDFFIDQSRISKIAEDLQEVLKSTVGTIINKELGASIKNISCHNVGDSFEYSASSYLHSSGRFAGKVEGGFHILLPMSNALEIGGLMCMMEGDELKGFVDKGFDDEALDALGEVMSQLTGQLATSLRAEFKEVSGAIEDTKELDLKESLSTFEECVDGDEIVFLPYEITIPDSKPFVFYLVFSNQLAFAVAGQEGVDVSALDKSEKDSLIDADGQDDGLFEEDAETSAAQTELNKILDLKVNIRVLLAERKFTIEELLKTISVGSIVEFNVPFDNFLDLVVNDRKVGEGEVITVNDVYGLQVKGILSAKDTIATIL